MLLIFTENLLAQNVTDLRFNEILVRNDSLNVDDFGEHSAWIEIFNSGYNTVDIGDETVAVTASFGVTGVEDESRGIVSDSDAFVNIADQLLYSAKAQGRNQVVSRPFAPEMNPALQQINS